MRITELKKEENRYEKKGNKKEGKAKKKEERKRQKERKNEIEWEEIEKIRMENQRKKI